jgi:S-adenosyl-L-methionine hydrolase (adenosine-forming)
MIALFTDFGSAGPYVGQLHAVLAMTAPGTPVVDLFHDIPHYDIRAAAYLLPAYAALFPPLTVFICVVDPGVGGERRPLVLEADGKWYVGPDNGLFNLVLRRARRSVVQEISWRPPTLSASFHGRDLFAPVAAALAQGVPRESHPVTLAQAEMDVWPDDLAQVLYIDGYGNGISGVRSSQIPVDRVLRVQGQAVPHARVYGDVPPGQAFWYGNANGLVEIAVNCGSARRVLGLSTGDGITWL